MRTPPAPLSLVLAALLARPGVAQDPAAIGSRADGALATAIADFAELAATADTPLLLRPLAQKILDETGAAADAAIVREVQRLVDAAATWEELGEHTGTLFALAREHRLDAAPARLAPAVVLLERLAPRSAAVQHACLEVFGAAGPIRDPDRALDALARLRDLVPEEHDGSTELVATLRELAAFVGAPTGSATEDETETLGMLWRYWNTSRAILGFDEPVRRLAAADRVAMQHLHAIDLAYRDGDQKVLVERLKAWGEAQPENRVQAVLLACAYASYGNYNPNLAKRAVDDFPTQNGFGWSFATERCVFGQFGLELLTPKDLHLLVEQLAATKEARLEMADRRMLEAQLRRSEAKLAKLQEDMESTQQKAAHDRQVYEGLRAAPARPSRGTFDQNAATRRSNLATAFRNLKRSEANAKFALERWQREELKIRIWQARAARYRPTR